MNKDLDNWINKESKLIMNFRYIKYTMYSLCLVLLCGGLWIIMSAGDVIKYSKALLIVVAVLLVVAAYCNMRYKIESMNVDTSSYNNFKVMMSEDGSIHKMTKYTLVRNLMMDMTFILLNTIAGLIVIHTIINWR